MINRISKIESLETVGTWTLATRGEKQSKKNFKRDIKKRRRTIEKRMAASVINEYKKEEF
ncbi:hypothetical protein [Bacillus pumilus]|uniref:hypothetical protein n=1 Tax=Bacillus pumilus TaxID=1408 RepID=UPI00227E0760|nr:hypothetical protein [Bacillus pumilus]MCY7500214.1 hypothetical protein [Bacillus pumilus]MCY7528462.1 hypothetical protein [Bacillus pumilus]MED4441472.1 hypothetical protein [Bacillus pumilus]MED4490023.1 hypothetical protein [Bacillus pumilus]